MAYLLNCFPVEIAPEEFPLPSINTASWDASTFEIRHRFREFVTARASNDDGTVGIFLIDGPQLPNNLGQKLIGKDHFVYVVNELVKASVLSYFSTRGMRVQSDNFESVITTPSPQAVAGEVEVRTGLSIRIKLPPMEKIASMRLLLARWEVKRDFRSNLDNPELRKIALGKAVLYRPLRQPISDDPVPRMFLGRYLGYVEAIAKNGSVQVSCKDSISRTIQAEDLYLEPTTATLMEYEQTLRRTGSKSLWHKTQELSYALTASGRRNTSVLRDRLDAIRKFLNADTSPAIALPSPPYASVKLSLGLAPLTADVSPYV